MMKKTLLIFLLLLFLLPACALAKSAETAFYTDEQTGQSAAYPFSWLSYETKSDGTACLQWLDLSNTAAADMNGVLYLPTKVDDITVTAFETDLFNDMKLKGFTRLVIPPTVTGCVPADFYGSDGFVLKGGITKISLPGQNPSFTIAEDGSLLQGSSLTGLIYDESRTEIVLPEGVENADLSLLAEAYPNMAALTLPASLKELTGYTNQLPEKLEQIDVLPGNPVFRSTDGVLFQGGDLYLYPPANPAESYTIPEGTESISCCAFTRCENLREVILPESLNHLCCDAFSVCRGLRTVNIPAGLTRIEEGAFSYCWNLETIRLAPENPAFTFEGNLLIDKEKDLLLAAVCGDEQVTLPENIRTIGVCAFTNKSDMTHVVLNEGLETIGEDAFTFSGLTEICLPASLQTVGDSAFYGCDQLKQVTFGEGVSSLSRLGAYAFAYSTLESILFPADCPLATIGDSTFYDCRSLQEISLPGGLKEIGEFAFYDCIKLARIDLPDSITTLGEYCFSGCSVLHSLKLPQGITELDTDIIYESYGIRYLIIPSHVSLPSYLPDTLKKLNPYGHGRLVVHRGSDAHDDCLRKNIPCTLYEELPFCLGELRVTATTDALLQQFLDEGGSLTFGWKNGYLTITQKPAEGEGSVLGFPCTIRDGKLMLGDEGYLNYTMKDITHVELVSNQWTMQLEGKDLP